MTWSIEPPKRSTSQIKIVDTETGDVICSIAPKIKTPGKYAQLISKAPALERVYLTAKAMAECPVNSNIKALLAAIKEVENV